jgi:hypothetical protein
MLYKSRNTKLFFSLLFLYSCSTGSTPVYQLITNVEPAETGSVTQSVLETEQGETITITANAYEHWVFYCWSGDYTGTDNPASILMDRDKSVTAVFEKRDYPLTITIEGDGSVEERVIQQKSTDYPQGSVVELTATPSNGWMFFIWSGDVESTDQIIEVIVESETNLTVRFKRIDYSLKINVEGEGKVEQRTISKPKISEYLFETAVELTATPSAAWKFIRWGGDLAGSENPKIVTLDSDTDITAHFEFDLNSSDNLIRILTNDNGDGTFSDTQFTSILGIEIIDNKLRLYYGNKNPDKIFIIDTYDLLKWTAPREVLLPLNWNGFNRIGVFYHKGWKGYGRADGIYLFQSDDGIEFEVVGKAFEWKLDTIYSFFYDERKQKYVGYGRVRGNRTGGWRSDQNPEIDRRGISFHSNKNWSSNWSNGGEIIADPLDFWDYDSEMIPDFYTANIYWDEKLSKYRSLTNVFWREKRRIISNYRNVFGNSRNTGEMYPIIMESDDGVNFSIVTTESPIPLAPHRRYGYNPPWYGESNTEQTCSQCYEVGQIIPFIRPISFNGEEYIFYVYKDHNHYEKPNYMNVENSIYAFRL